MIERLDLIEKRYHEINELLMTPEVLSDVRKSKELSIESSTIEDVYNCYQKYKSVLNDLESANEMLEDPELSEFASEEVSRLTAEKTNLESELEV